MECRCPGRSSVWRLRAQAVLAKFPDAAVEEWAPVLFLPLVTRLVNDPVAGVRTAVGHTLRTLLQVRS